MGNKRFLCLQIYNHLSLKTDTDQINPKLNGAVRSVVHINYITIKNQFFSFSSMLRHGIIYWDNLVSRGKILTLERKVGRIT